MVTLFADHRLRTGLQHEVGDALTAGTGVVVAMAKPASRTSIEHVLRDAIQVSAVDFAGSTSTDLE